jgi:hypothetical protein
LHAEEFGWRRMKGANVRPPEIHNWREDQARSMDTQLARLLESGKK